MTRLFYGSILLFLGLSSYAQEPLKISNLTGDFYIFTTYRSFQGEPFPSNGMYVLTKSGVVMFDTPWDTTQFQPLLDSIMARHHSKVVFALSTHSHNDRTGGLAFLREKGVKTYTSRLTDEIGAKNGERRAACLFEKDTVFTIGQYTFQTYYPGEGHTRDNIVIWFADDRVLYGGCLIKSTEATNLGYTAEANLEHWSEAIRILKKRYGNARFIIPGHQNWASTEALNHTLSLLKKAGK